MQAVVASLLELPLERVPEFRGNGDEYSWWDEYIDFMKSNGYEFHKIIGNPRTLGAYGEDGIIDLLGGKHEGINGDFFYATVYSPYFFDRVQYICNPKYTPAYHAVVVDREMNIIHDPHPHYQGVKQYPLHELINYNGVVAVDIFKPII